MVQMKVKMHASVERVVNIMNSNVKMEIVCRNTNFVIVFMIVGKMIKLMNQKNVHVTATLRK